MSMTNSNSSSHKDLHARFASSVPDSLHQAAMGNSSKQAGEGGDAPESPALEPAPGAIPYSRPSTPKAYHDRLAFVGLGNMGSQMAKNLARHLHKQDQPPLTVWNRSADKLEAFKKMADDEGIPYQVAKDLKEVAHRCDMIVTSLGSDAAVEAVYAELFAGVEEKAAEREKEGYMQTSSHHGRSGGSRPTIFVDTSTVYPDTAGKLERQCSANRHGAWISSPVFGPPPLAAQAGLVLAISGSYQAKKHVAHALVPAIGRKVMDLGSNVERAMAFKLVGNSMVLGILELLAESMTLAEQTGVGADKLYDLIQDFFPAPSFIGYGKKMLTNDFKGENGFTLQGGIKDASHIRRLAEEASVPMPIIDIAHQHLVSARANGGDQLDWSSLVGGERISAGLPPFSTKQRLQRDD